jgi:hypothetical protein
MKSLFVQQHCQRTKPSLEAAESQLDAVTLLYPGLYQAGQDLKEQLSQLRTSICLSTIPTSRNEQYSLLPADPDSNFLFSFLPFSAPTGELCAFRYSRITFQCRLVKSQEEKKKVLN